MTPARTRRRPGWAVGLGLLVMAAAGGSAAGQTQREMNGQARAQYQAADRALNLVYGKLIAEASPGGRARLQAAERDWLRFRESDCRARTGSRDGSAYPMMLAHCLASVTQDRVKQLTAELHCPEGDLGCGGGREP